MVELPGYDQGAELRGLVPLPLRTKNIPVPGDTGIEVPYLDRGHHQTGGPHVAILTELLAAGAQDVEGCRAMAEDLFVQGEGPRLAVRDYGGSGPAIVLLHGGYGNLSSFDYLGPLLTPGMRVVAYDQRGHGWSERGPVGVREFAQDLARVVEILELDRPVLYGGSFGTLVGLAYLLEGGPARGFITEDGRLKDFPAVLRDEDPPIDPSPPLSTEAWQDYLDRFSAAGPTGTATAMRSAVYGLQGRIEIRPTAFDVFTKMRSFAQLPVRRAYRIAPRTLALLARQGVDLKEREAEVDALGDDVDLVAAWFDTGHWISASATEALAEEVITFVHGLDPEAPTGH